MSKFEIIAHRGLVYGPDKSLENHPEQIDKAIVLGFSCEVDLWVKNNQLWLGHDEPTYTIDIDYLSSRPLWIHAKNLEALRFLTDHSDLVYFWHQNDDYTITSNGYIWAQPGKPSTDKTIIVMPEWTDPSLKHLKSINCFAICTDFVFLAKEIIS